MIVSSEFDSLIKAGLSPVVLALQQYYNGSSVVPTYSFRQGLGKKYSVDGTYKALGVDNGLIVADVIALDSPLPVKSRPAISSASGEIPKIGTELPMNETELKQLRLLKRAGGDLAQINSMLFSDVRRVYGGTLEQLEYQYLEGLSTGVIVRDTDNVGIGVRVDFGYDSSNQFNASVVWGQAGYTALGDIITSLNNISQAGKSVVKIKLDRQALNQLLQSDDAKNFVAAGMGVSLAGAITLARLNDYFSAEYGAVFELVDRSVTVEKNGVKKAIKPWAAGRVVFECATQVGTLVWSTVEEMEAPVGGVNYSRAEDMILISQYRLARPSLRQFTGAQAVALTVIDKNVVYTLDTTAIA